MRKSRELACDVGTQAHKAELSKARLLFGRCRSQVERLVLDGKLQKLGVELGLGEDGVDAFKELPLRVVIN